MCAGNIVRRVLYFIREEYSTHLELEGEGEEEEEEPSAKPRTLVDAVATPPLLRRSSTVDGKSHLNPTLQGLLSAASLHKDSYDRHFKDLKSDILEDINLLLEELKSLYHNISGYALDHIHTNEVIMTFGSSNTVKGFLMAAARKRNFHVVVAESAPELKAQQLAVDLAEAGIDTTLITDAAIFGMMSRVNKVIVGTHAVMANGGLLANSGVRLLAEAARYHSVPFVVCVGSYKISPQHITDKTSINDLTSPGQILRFDQVDSICKAKVDVQVQNPSLDYIPPELVSLLLTNHGGHIPSYIYRLLSECYDQGDLTLKRKGATDAV